MTPGVPKRRSIVGWVIAAVLAIPVVIGVAADMASLSGYSLKDLKDPEKANAVSRALEPAVHTAVSRIPLWVLPASWLVAWLFVEIVKYIRGAHVVDETAVLLERQRETSTVFKEWGEAQRKWGELMRTEREQDRQKMAEEVERMAAGFISLKTELDATGQGLTVEQRKSRLANYLINELEKQTFQLAIKIRKTILNDTNNFVDSYTKVRKDGSSFIKSFINGAIEGPAPESRNYVQRMIYYAGAMTWHFERLETEVRQLGLLPAAVWDVFVNHGTLDAENFNKEFDKRISSIDLNSVMFLESLVLALKQDVSQELQQEADRSEEGESL